MPRRLTLGLTFAGIFAASLGHATDSGSYLAARTALINNDFDQAARYFSRAIVHDKENPLLLESGAHAFLGLGDLEKASNAAQKLYALGSDSQIIGLSVAAQSAADSDWSGYLAALENGMSVGPLFDGLAKGWALVGDGRMTEALAAFDALSESQGVESFAFYHKALAMALAGDFEGSSQILSGGSGTTLHLTRRGIIAYAQVLSQLERNGDAIELISATFGTNLDPALEELSNSLKSGETQTFTAVRSAGDGLAEVYFSIAGALQGEAQDGYTLLYAQAAKALRPDSTDALLLTAELLEGIERYDLATEVYDTVPRTDPSFHAAELGRAEALRRSGREDAAIEVLRQLTESHGHLPLVHVSLGDTLRGMERYAEATQPYNNALELIETPEEQHWIIFFARAIAFERIGEWELAEADFLKALELKPEQPQVMNYLGYSYLEKQTNYDEALDLIQRAVDLRPNSGYIIDSLGWGLYRLGRYDEAVGHMEKAVEHMPIDPIVNDHLGDVYWAVGRYREAEFQWHRALSFINDDTDLTDVDPDRIRRKLEVGLDAVLAEEGAPPLQMANDDG